MSKIIYKKVLDIKGKDECWPWLGTKTITGYGRKTVKGKTYQAHAWYFTFFTGIKIPDGFEIHHLCKNRVCCNPAHLKVISKREHMILENQHRAKAKKNKVSDDFSKWCAAHPI